MELLSLSGAEDGKRADAEEDGKASLEADEAVVADVKERLEGQWRLVYCTSPEVAPILTLNQLPWPLRDISPNVVEIRQRFTRAGNCFNEIDFSVPLLFDSLTFEVRTLYRVESSRRLSLSFQESRVLDLVPSDQLETVLAFSLSPFRVDGLALLRDLREFTSQRVPLTSIAAAGDAALGQPPGYAIEFLDDTVFVGRQLEGGGLFVFDRKTV